MSPTDIYTQTLDTIRQCGNFRHTPFPPDPGVIPATDFSSNDYLGLAATPRLQNEFFRSAGTRASLTSSASRLLVDRRHQSYALLEDTLTRLYNRPALLFNSGYHANTGLIPALASLPRTLILADRLVHASIIDGIILSRTPFRRFPHNNLDALGSMLEKASADFDRIWVIVESVYSMDGDSANLPALVALKRRWPKMLLYVDEAHAFGVTGPGGLGQSMTLSSPAEVDIIVGTLGKAAASSGAFCICSHTLRDFAVNRARSLIFSTALPPLCCQWSRFIIERIPGMDSRRHHLARLSNLLHDGLTHLGLAAPDSRPSHIQPVIIGDAAKTVQLSAQLLDDGFNVLPIRTPTVPPGTERLRISLSANLDESDVTGLLKAIEKRLK